MASGREAAILSLADEHHGRVGPRKTLRKKRSRHGGEVRLWRWKARSSRERECKAHGRRESVSLRWVGRESEPRVGSVESRKHGRTRRHFLSLPTYTSYAFSSLVAGVSHISGVLAVPTMQSYCVAWISRIWKRMQTQEAWSSFWIFITPSEFFL